MRIFLGVIMVLIVSGDDETISSILNGSVLLPCSCPERDVNKGFYWQMERPKMSVLTYSNGTSTFKGRYEGRGKIFLPEHRDNCSVLLTNVKADDQGEYRCSFHSQGLYTKIFVNLNVYASYTVCQMNYSNSSECSVEGRYRDAEIQWDLDGRPLTSSPTTNVTLNDSTGVYHFRSIITDLNGASTPACTVKAKGLSAIIVKDCKTEMHAKRTDHNTSMRFRCLTIIPIVSVLGFFLVLWRRWKFSRSTPTIRRRETGNCYCKQRNMNSNVTI